MLADRLRTSTVLIAIAAGLFVADASSYQRVGEGVCLLPLLIFFAAGTASDFCNLLQPFATKLPRRLICVGTA
ncbi:MAG: CDP-archaeol synthase, partial [Planctomycetota bacterium]